MKRKILVLILGIFIFVSSGCGDDNSAKEKVCKDIESNNDNISIEENETNIATNISSDWYEKDPILIKEIAFNWLDDERKESIINMDDAKIEKVSYKEDYFIVSNEGSINIKDRVVHKVTFDTSAEVLGSIVIYLDKDNGEVLGTEIRK